MALDAFKNLAFSTVATAPSPAASGTSLDVAVGTGTRFPAVPFNATVWPTATMPDPTTAEIVRVTGIASDTLTITRTQEGTSARTIVAGDQIAATVTALTLDTLSAEIATASALATTADTHANTVSAAVTIASALATTADAHANTVSAAVTIASALATTADSHANTVSAQLVSVSAALTAAIQTASAAANTVSAQLVSVSAALTVTIQTASALATTADTHANTASVAANTISAQLVSVSAALTSAIQVASVAANTVSAQLVSVSAALTSAIAGRAPWISAVYAIVANSQTINTSAIAGVSGLAFAVAANSLWQFEGIAYVSVSAVAGGLRFGTSVAGGLAAAPRFLYAQTFATGTQNPQAATGILGGFGLIGQSGLTTILSATSIASAGLAFPIWFNGTVLASASGNVQIAAGTIASSAASPAVVLAGSYIKAVRLS